MIPSRSQMSVTQRGQIAWRWEARLVGMGSPQRPQ